MTDASVTCNVRIRSDDKLHQPLPLTKTSFPRTSVRIPLRTNCRLPYPSSLLGQTFRRVLGWIIFSLRFRPALKRRRESSLEMTADSLFSRGGDSLTNPVNSIRRGRFLFIAIERAVREREGNQGFGGGKRDTYMRTARTYEKIGSPRGNVSNERKLVKSEMEWRSEEETTISPWRLIGHHRQPRVVCRVNRCSTTQWGILLQPAWKSLECTDDPDRPAVARWTLYLQYYI